MLVLCPFFLPSTSYPSVLNHVIECHPYFQWNLKCSCHRILPHRTTLYTCWPVHCCKQSTLKSDFFLQDPISLNIWTFTTEGKPCKIIRWFKLWFVGCAWRLCTVHSTIFVLYILRPVIVYLAKTYMMLWSFLHNCLHIHQYYATSLNALSDYITISCLKRSFS